MSKTREILKAHLGEIKHSSSTHTSTAIEIVEIDEGFTDDDLVKIHIAQQTARLRSIDQKLSFFIALAVIGVIIGGISALL